MHRALTARWLSRALRLSEVPSPAGLPVFLCPAASYPIRGAPRRILQAHRRHNHTNTVVSDDASAAAAAQAPSIPARDTRTRSLPLTCSGCGAFSQTSEPDQLGYFTTTSKRVKGWLYPKEPDTRHATEEDRIVLESLKQLDPTKLEALGLKAEELVSDDFSAETANEAAEVALPKPPVCDRCHHLLHSNTTGSAVEVPMYHPTVESLRETIEESPYKYNHIYHVIDAADFPMSLVPRLHVLLGDVSLRTSNRRSRSAKFYSDRQFEMSFIITRSDLLGPTKETVDSMMPYLREVLREALGRVGGRVRLGNVRCVSARRGWWTKELQEDIWARGGAGWMVGKVNVGKSQLFATVFPKGRVGDVKGSTLALRNEAIAAIDEPKLDIGNLLPPPQRATDYPEMPVVSSLPGTTASPIRVPFGKGKGELIDLPGLARSDLETYVKPEHRQSLILKKRIVPEQISVKPGKSLLLGGGLIRITPRTPDLIFLMYNFTPLEEHLTSTEKAVGFQEQTRSTSTVKNITSPGVGEKMKLAGTFELRYDVTKQRAGPLTRKNAVGLQVERLPFRVLSLDILIEGVGYVEIVAQVRARDLELSSAVKTVPENEQVPEPSDDPFEAMLSQRRDTGAEKPRPEVRANTPKASAEASKSTEPDWPLVDVFTPEGRFIGTRRPIDGYLNNKRLVKAKHKKSRPRKSMKGAKKQAKLDKRARAAPSSES
ncbi:interactor of prohibitin [Paramyrothecium foliicola]|nr:interactor of prohibitin [Paramyrothecium foliicola]